MLKEELLIDGWSHGGEGVGRLSDGRAIFVPGAILGERVLVDVVMEQKRFARGEIAEIIEASEHRLEEPACNCPGCVLSFIEPDYQLTLKEKTIREQLERIGKLSDPPVEGIIRPAIWPNGYRSTARMILTDDGRMGFSANRSNEIVPIDRCATFTPELLELVEKMDGKWAGAEFLRLLAFEPSKNSDGSENSGFLVEVFPGDGGLPSAPEGDYTYAINSVGVATTLKGDGFINATISPQHSDPFTLRVGAGSFFQSGVEPAGTLVDLVLELAQVNGDDEVVDLYSGVGLFTVPLDRQAAHVTAVESSGSATDDAMVNLEGTGTTIYHDDCLSWLKEGKCPSDAVVILDPPRAGAGKEVIDLLAETNPKRVVHVGCDIASFARDMKDWAERGYKSERIVGVDMFAHTAHVETVALLSKDI